MIFALHCLACIGVWFIFKMFGDSFISGWFGGILCMAMLRFVEQVPA